MPSYKLYYFNGKGRGEGARLLFALAGVKYEDIRLEGEKWQEFKPKTPLGQMPVLEVDGVMIAQSAAINRYLAKELGFMGSNNLETAKIDVVIETVRELSPSVMIIFMEKDEAKKAELKKDFVENTLPANAAQLEKLLVSNDGGDGFFVGKKLSLADVRLMNYFHDFLPMVTGAPVNLDATPKLKAVLQRVLAVPEIATWIKKRPVTKI